MKKETLMALGVVMVFTALTIVLTACGLVK